MKSMDNEQGMTVDSAGEGHGPRCSVFLSSKSNSLTNDHRRSRLLSVVTSGKGHVRNLSGDGKKTGENTMSSNSSQSPVPPPRLPMPNSAPPIPKSSTVNASLPKPCYVPRTPPLECTVNEEDNRSGGGNIYESDDHDYDYLDLDLLKIQMERDKKKEKQMTREMDPRVTKHDSENSLYETIPSPGQKNPEEGIKTQSKDEKTNKMKIDQPCLPSYDSINSLYEASNTILKELKTGKEGVHSNEKQKEDNTTKKEKSETHGRDSLDPTARTRCYSGNSPYETVPTDNDHPKTKDEGIKSQSTGEKTSETTEEAEKGEKTCLPSYDSINSLYEAVNDNFKNRSTGKEEVPKPKEEQEQQDVMITKKEDQITGSPCRQMSVDENPSYDSSSRSATEEDNNEKDDDDDDDACVDCKTDEMKEINGDGNEGSTDDKGEDNKSKNESIKNTDHENMNGEKESSHGENDDVNDGVDNNQGGRKDINGDGNEGSSDDKEENKESENEGDESNVKESIKNTDRENTNKGKESTHEENTLL